jgi:hypothetical protein
LPTCAGKTRPPETVPGGTSHGETIGLT